MKSKLLFLVLLAVSLSGYAQSSDKETAARNYITSHSEELKIKPTDNFKLSFVRKSLSGETLRFQQIINDVPVYQSEIVVHFNPSNEVSFVSDSYNPLIESINTNPSISKEIALSKSAEHLKIQGEYNIAETDLLVVSINNETRLVYRIVTNPANGNGSWEVMIDATNGNILSTKDVAVYSHKKEQVSKSKKDKKEEQPKKENRAPLEFVSGTAMVYLSDPLSFAQVDYGTTGYVDGNDANTTQLATARTFVTLPEIDLTAGVYKLKSSYVEIADFETPNKGLFTQATPDFNFTRNTDGFESANVFYHLDLSLRYINETLGITCRPTQNGGVLKFDPSGLSGADNSHYLPSSDQLAFGEGCVDDAEDADVIWHELGHGIHDWLTNGSTSGFIGEGNGDYWAQSYSRSLNQWQPADAAYQYMFSWDGHNVCWDGRTTDYFGIYPTDLVGGSGHDDGQIWATALMQIYDVIGRTKTDKAFLEGLSNTNSSTNQQNAARAVRQAAIDMNFPCEDVRTMTEKFTDRGYVMNAIPLTMATIPNQTVQADASNTYTLTSFATLANPITTNCDAGLVQSPIEGTVLTPGDHTITMTATSGATTVNRTFTLTVLPFLGVEDFNKNSFVIYPNPTGNVLNIKGNFISDESISIYNILGQVVMKRNLKSVEETLDVSELVAGIYTIQLNKSKVSQKFVKK